MACCCSRSNRVEQAMPAQFELENYTLPPVVPQKRKKPAQTLALEVQDSHSTPSEGDSEASVKQPALSSVNETPTPQHASLHLSVPQMRQKSKKPKQTLAQEVQGLPSTEGEEAISVKPIEQPVTDPVPQPALPVVKESPTPQHASLYLTVPENDHATIPPIHPAQVHAMFGEQTSPRELEEGRKEPGEKPTTFVSRLRESVSSMWKKKKHTAHGSPGSTPRP